MGRYTTYGTHAYRERGAVSEKSLETKVGLSKDFEYFIIYKYITYTNMQWF